MREEWISRQKWEAMLAQSRDLMNRIDWFRRCGEPNEELWKEIAPLNQRIRSPLLRVRGIDDRGASTSGEGKR